MNRGITCPDPETLEQLARGELDAETSSYLRKHLTECESCTDRVLSTAGTNSSLAVDEQALDAVPPLIQSVSLPNTLLSKVHQPTASQLSVEQLGPYRIIREIGRGGMGAIYEAIHTTLDKPVAVKVLPEDRTESDAFVQRFRREMKAIGKLDHPNIVRATDAGQADGIHYLAMDLVEGVDLATISKRMGMLRVADACEIVAQAAEGLHYAHRQGRIHRDIKPSNLMITTTGKVKILDLGLALLSDTEDELSTFGHTMGTLDYMAPEQANNSSQVDDHADIYSLGCTLFKMLTGHGPFSRERLATPFQESIPRLDQTRSDVPGELVELLEQMLDMRASHRPDAGEVSRRLKPFTRGADLAQLVGPDNHDEASSARPRSPDTTGKFLPSAMTSTEREAVGEGSPMVKPARRHLRGMAIALGLAAVGIALAAGPTIYRIVTNQALVTVEMDESIRPEVTLEIRGPQQVTLNEKNGFRVHLEAGNYLISPGGASDRFTLSENELTLRRGDKRLVRVSVESRRPGAIDVARDREQAAVEGNEGADLVPTTVSLTGLVPRPAQLTGIRQWNIESVSPRSIVGSVRWSPEGKHVAVACDDGQLRLFDAQTGRLEQLFSGHTGAVTSVDWSPDGKWILTGSLDQSARLWSLNDRRPGPVYYMWSPVRAVAWDPSGSHQFACCTWTDGIKIFDVDSQQATRTLAITRGQPNMVAWSPDGKWIATNPTDESRTRWLEIWSVTGTEPAKSFKDLGGPRAANHRGEPIAWSPDSKTIATSTGYIRLLDVESGDLRILELADTYALAWSPDGRYVAGGNQYSEVAVFDSRTGQEVHRTRTNNGVTLSLDWDRHSRRLIFGGYHGNVSMISMADRKVGLSLGTQVGVMMSKGSYWTRGTVLASSQDDKWLATGGSDGMVRRWESATGRPGQSIQRTDSIRSIALGPDGRVVISRAKDGSVVRWDVEADDHLVLNESGREADRAINLQHRLSPDGRQLAVVNDDSVEVRSVATGESQHQISLADAGGPAVVAWDSQSARLAIGTHDNAIRIWTVGSDEPDQIIEIGYLAGRIHWNPKKNQIAVLKASRQVQWLDVWDLDSGRKQWNAQVHVTQVQWSPDGEKIVGSCFGYAIVFDGKTGEQVWTRVRNGVNYQQCYWSPNGQRLVAFGDYPFMKPNNVSVFSTTNENPLFTIPGLSETSAVSWSRDSSRLTAASLDRLVRQWNAETGDPLWVAVELPQGEAATFSPSGQLLYETEGATKELVWIVQNSDGTMGTLRSAEFHQLTGVDPRREAN